MSLRKKDIENLRSAKEALRDKYGYRAWFRGVGIAPSDEGLILRLNVDPTSKVRKGEIPKEFQGFKVDVVFIDTYEPRRS